MNVDFRAVLSEFQATCGFLYLGLGTAVLTGDLVMTSLVFGLSVAVFIFASQHSRAGQMNPLVTIAMAVTGYISSSQAVLLCIAQFAGSVAASSLLLLTIPEDKIGSLAANEIQSGFHNGNAFVGEVVCAFVLQLTVFETMLNPRNKAGKMAPLAVGFVVFVSHGVLVEIDNCSLNPARTFGPALLKAKWDDIWVFFAGPILGGLLAIPPHILFLSEWGVVPLPSKKRITTERRPTTELDV